MYYTSLIFMFLYGIYLFPVLLILSHKTHGYRIQKCAGKIIVIFGK